MTDLWHITGDTLRDGTTLPPDGVWLRLPKGVTPKHCERGYHACPRLIDCLPWAVGEG